MTPAMTSPGPEQAVICETDGPVLVITLNRPRVKNAIDSPLSLGVVDALAREAMRIAASHGSRREIFGYLWNLVRDHPLPQSFYQSPGPPIPHLDEPWYCCAEPTEEQIANV